MCRTTSHLELQAWKGLACDDTSDVWSFITGAGIPSPHLSRSRAKTFDARRFACINFRQGHHLQTPSHHTTTFFFLSQSLYILIMATNTKYHAAPQRDSFEERPYTQAPPSYQAAGPSDGLLGSPRGEDDNVPDDFKVRPCQSHPKSICFS